MATPPETTEHLASPSTDSSQQATVRLPEIDIETILRELADKGVSEAGLERLRALSLLDNDPRFVSAYVCFAAERESLQTLTDWSEDSLAAKALGAIGHAASSIPGLVDSIRPVTSADLTSDEMYGDLTTQYVAAMAASRRPVIEDAPPHFIEFIQRLRVLLLVRTMEALERGLAQEKTLKVACIATRRACDISGDPRVKWLMAIASHEEDFEEFRYDLQARCQLAKKDRKQPDAARALFRALEVIAAGGPWRPTSSKLKVPEVSLHHRLHGAPDVAPPFFTAPGATPPTDIVFVETKGDSSLGLVITAADESHTNYRNGRIGQGLILDSVEGFQFLRHSWHHLSHVEESSYYSRIQELLASSDEADRVGAVLTLIATIAGRPLSGTGTIPLSPDIAADWSIDAQNGLMHRQPPRFGRRWKLEDHPKAKSWLAPRAKKWEVQLCQAATNVLRDLAHALPSKDLAELWSKVGAGVTIHEWFGNRFAVTTALWRLSSPCTSTVLSQQAFEQMGSQNLARLVGSEQRTALPAACAYGAYGSNVVVHALKQNSVNPLFAIAAPTRSENLNACGSDLDILIERIRQQISGLVGRTRELGANGANWIEHHNSLTSLVVIALLASTGSRPVNSPFESLMWFDFERMILYVEDKRSGPTRGARLCILTTVAHELLTQHYLPHLERCADDLSAFAPEFSAELRRILARDPHANLPLFFYLCKGNELDWVEVSEQRLATESEIDWPLPWNLFRHIHATELVRRGVHPEVVDALLAHGDRGAESHGDHSLRIPEADLALARPHIEALQTDLGLTCPELGVAPPKSASPIKLAPSCAEPRRFGRAARSDQRAATERRARERALSDIRAMIAEKPPDSLSSDDWHRIARKMLFREDDVPHPSASVRYEEFERFVDQLWQESRIIPKLKRRYTVLPEPDSIICENCVEAPQRLRNLRQAFDLAVESIGNSQIAPPLAAVLGAIDLVLSCGVAYRKPLISLLTHGPSIRVVKAFKGYWFEWTDAEKWRDGRPMFRVPILPRTARWIDAATAATKRYETPTTFPTQLDFLAHGPSVASTLTHLAAMQDQVNVWAMPGIEAAYLAGRAMFPALPHCDWFRVTTGTARVAPETGDEANSEVQYTLDDVYFMAHHQGSVRSSSPPSATACAQLFDKISQTVRKSGAQVEACRSSIEGAIKASGFGPGDVPFLLGHFVLHLLKRKSKKGARDPLRMDTVIRYLKSLAPPLIELAHDQNLCELDEEELTELYCAILEWWTDHFQSKRAAASQREDEPDKSTSRLTPEEQATDAASRTLSQLREFHEFASIVYGLDDPDWSMISTGKVGAIGRPGLVTLSEYRLARSALVNARSIDKLPDDDLSQAFVLLCCARFGLRIGEAVGMNMQDWIESDGAVVLLVRPNRVRSLKTTNSKRQIPLCEEIDTEEREIIAEILRRWAERHTDGQVAPMLPGVSAESFASIRNAIGGALRELLKASTRNPATTIHFLRHSFASRILALLRGFSLGEGEKIEQELTLHVRRLLLGSDRLDRRTLWAIARLLGHSSPSVSARCYLHGLDIWLSKPDGWHCSSPMSGLSGAVIDLDLSELDSTYGHVAPSAKHETVLIESSMLTLTRYCRLLVQGRTQQDALRISKAAASAVAKFEGVLRQYEDQFAPPKPPVESEVPADVHAGEPVPGLLTSISLQRWGALIAEMKNRPRPVTHAATFDIAETLGRKRHVVLFLDPHYETLVDIVSWLELDSSQVWVIPCRKPSPPTSRWIETKLLSSFVKPVDKVGASFQLDTAVHGPYRLPFPSRSVLIPAVGGNRFQNTFEVMFIWLAWHCCQATQLAH